MALFSRAELSNLGFTAEQTDALMGLSSTKLEAGYISKADAKAQVEQLKAEAAKAEQERKAAADAAQAEYAKVTAERDMLRAISGDDFSTVKPKFREQVFGMLDRGEKAPSIADQLKAIGEKFDEFFVPQQPAEETKNTPQYSQQPGFSGTNPQSPEDAIIKQISEAWK